MQQIPWYQLGVNETLQRVDSRMSGLTEEEVAQRQVLFHNSLESSDKNRPWFMFLNQFTDTMVLVLLGATVVSGVIGAMADAMTILAIVIVNAVLGFVQEYRAEKSLEAIKKMASPHAHVIREGRKQSVEASQLVPGDMICLEAGDRIPADVRFVETSNLEVEEAALTGESVPVEKNTRPLHKPAPLAEQFNLGFMGTSVTRGRGVAVVIETGMNTEMGKIASLMKDADSGMTPLQRKLDQLGKVLIIICLAVCGVVAAMGIARGEPVMTMLMAGISLAVAAIPEGLPAIVTVVLALGVQRMAHRNAIVRKLPAVETLGCTTVICSDKTGTLTQNQMTVTRVATEGISLTVQADGNSAGPFWSGRRRVNLLNDAAMMLLMQIACHCNNAQIHYEKGVAAADGDPTEAALMIMADKAGCRTSYPRIREIPFDSDRKRMSVIVDTGRQYLLFTKGALDQLLSLCSGVEGIKDHQQAKKRFVLQQEEWAEGALRVLGFAYRVISREQASLCSDAELETNLTLVGICGMIDPPRQGVVESVQTCQRAGVTPVMITGDHPSTARAIAQEIGLSGDSSVVTGVDIDQLSDEQLYRRIMKGRVFARVTPQHKNRIVKVLQQHRHVVAMTGDGVNDAPAIKAADIGIAMGISGTEVTKEASSMILADDDFSTIVRAVYEGRAIYDNIRKFIRYLLGCNIGEVLVMFMASLLGMPLPLLPIQILWVNLVTDGLPAMALGLEPPEPGIMERKPRPVNEGVFSRGLGWIIMGRGLFIGVITLISFTIGLLWFRVQGIDDLSLARSMALTTLVLAQLFYVFECRSERYSPFELGFFMNKFLVIAVVISLSMQLGVLYLPALQSLFDTVGLNWWQWLIILILSGAKFMGNYILYTWRRFFDSTRRYVTMGAK